MNKKSETALEYFFYGEEFELWKLSSTEEYLYFIGMIVFAFIAIKFVKKFFKSRRTQEHGVRRVWKRLEKLAKKPYQLFKSVTLKLPSGEHTFDAMLMDNSGIYLVKVFGWGIKVFGTPDGETWRLEDKVRKETVENPLREMKQAAAEMQTVLEQHGVKRIKIQPLVVFADIFDTPELFLGYGSNSTTYQELKVWYQKQAGVKTAQYDFERVSSILKKEVIK